MSRATATDITVRVDGTEHTVHVDNRVTLLDLLREHLGVTAPKKGCDHGQCGSCTVLLDGRRATTCLAFAVAHDGAEVQSPPPASATPTTCTPSPRPSSTTTASSAATARPARSARRSACSTRSRPAPPATSATTSRAPAELTDAEIRERMSGNLCRCAAYPNIVDAIQKAAR